jgi:hypothetical protein
MVRQTPDVDRWLRRTHLSAGSLPVFRTPGKAWRVSGVEIGPQVQRIQHYTYDMGGRTAHTSLSIRYRLVSAPYWLIALAAAAPAAALLPGVLRRRAWRRTGRCSGCGYDIRATPDRCPECGAVPAAADRVAA